MNEWRLSPDERRDAEALARWHDHLGTPAHKSTAAAIRALVARLDAAETEADETRRAHRRRARRRRARANRP